MKVILSDCSTGLPDDSVDVVLLYDTFHGLARPADVLRELHRVLKTDGVLSFHDHHMKEQEHHGEFDWYGDVHSCQKGSKDIHLRQDNRSSQVRSCP